MSACQRATSHLASITPAAVAGLCWSNPERISNRHYPLRDAKTGCATFLLFAGHQGAITLHQGILGIRRDSRLQRLHTPSLAKNWPVASVATCRNFEVNTLLLDPIHSRCTSMLPSLLGRLIERIQGFLRALGRLPSLTLRWFSSSSDEPTTNEFGNPLPKVAHRHVGADTIKQRCIIVGDIHGCFDEFQDLLQKTKYSADDCTLVLVGDLVNKGPKSVEVVQYCREHNVLSVRGNHDEACLNHALNRNSKPIPEKYEYVHKFTEEDIAWLQELPYTLEIPSLDAIIVHAGIVPGVPLAEQKVTDMVSGYTSMVLNSGKPYMAKYR